MEWSRGMVWYGKWGDKGGGRGGENSVRVTYSDTYQQNCYSILPF